MSLCESSKKETVLDFSTKASEKETLTIDVTLKRKTIYNVHYVSGQRYCAVSYF